MLDYVHRACKAYLLPVAGCLSVSVAKALVGML